MRRLFLQMSDQGLSAFRLSPSPRAPEGTDVRARLGRQSRHSAQSRPSDRISLRIQQKIPLRKRIFPFQALPDALPEKHSPSEPASEEKKESKRSRSPGFSRRDAIFSIVPSILPGVPPAFLLRFGSNISAPKSKIKRKKARPDRTGSGKLTSLRRFLCLCCNL